MKTGLCSTSLAYARKQRLLFQGLDLDLQAGCGLWISGSNGSGKSSLLRVLAGLICPIEGELYWQGQNLNEHRLAYHQALHFLGHQHGIKNKLSVKENLLYSQELAGSDIDSPNLEAALEKLNLLELQDVQALHLSAGQKQRLGLARLLATPKPLWILDEPFTNLDHQSQIQFGRLLEQHLQKGGMVILASHQALPLENKSAFQILTLPTGELAHV